MQRSTFLLLQSSDFPCAILDVVSDERWLRHMSWLTEEHGYDVTESEFAVRFDISAVEGGHSIILDSPHSFLCFAHFIAFCDLSTRSQSLALTPHYVNAIVSVSPICGGPSGYGESLLSVRNLRGQEVPYSLWLSS